MSARASSITALVAAASACALALSACATLGPPPKPLPVDAVEPLIRAGKKVESAVAATKLLIERSRGADYLPDLYMRLAELYTEQGRYAWLVQFEKRHARGDNSRAIDVPAARLLKNLAISTYDRVLREFPKYPRADQALFLMAHEYRELGEFDHMRESYEKLVAQFPSSPQRMESWLILGDTAFDAGDLERAERAYSSVLATPDSRIHPLARYKLGWVRVNKEDCKGAVALFERILRDRSTPRGAQVLIATQRSLDLRREALIDLAYCYPDVYPDKPAGPFLRALAETSSDYLAAMRRVAKRFTLKQLYGQAAAALRDVLGATAATDEALEDARRLYDNVTKARAYEFAALDVARMSRAYEFRVHDFRIDAAAREKLTTEFEIYARDLATKAQLAARERRSPALQAVAAAAYGEYLDHFQDTPSRLEMQQNRAEALSESEQPLAAARAFEQVAAQLEDGDPRRQARTNAIAAYQQALERAGLSRIERIVAWGGIREQGRALLAEAPKDERAPKIKLGVARTYYDAGEYLPAADLLFALSRQYPETREGIAAAHLALDAMRLAESYDRLATLGRRMIADPRLGDAKFKQELGEIVTRSEQRQVAELTIASGDDQQERLLSYAKKYKGSGLGEQALYNALLVARTDGDIDRFTGLAEEFVDQYERSSLRPEVLSSLADAATDRGDFTLSARYLEQSYAADPRGKNAGARIASAAAIRAALGDDKLADDLKELVSRGAPRRDVDGLLLDAARAGNFGAVEDVLRQPAVSGPVAQLLRGYLAWQRGDRDDAAKRLNELAVSRIEVDAVGAEAVARARFLFGDLVYDAFLAAGTGELATAIGEKTQLLAATDGAYAQAITGQRPRWSLAALSRVADAYARYGQFLTTLRLPDDLSADERSQLAGALKQKADEAVGRAAELRSTCAKRAREAWVFSDSTRACVSDEPFPERVPIFPPPAPRRVSNPPGAVELRKLLLKKPKDGDSLVKLAEAHLGVGDAAVALLLLERAEESDPRRADVHNLKGVALERIGESDEAYAELKRAVEMDDKNPQLRLNLAAHYLRYGYRAEALAEMRRAGGPQAVRGAPAEHPSLGALETLGGTP